MDTSPYMCKSNCVYKIDSESEELYCFQNGVLPVSCVNQKGRLLKARISHPFEISFLAPKITQVPIQEGNESIVQENHFHEETGILGMFKRIWYLLTIFVISGEGSTSQRLRRISFPLSPRFGKNIAFNYYFETYFPARKLHC